MRWADILRRVISWFYRKPPEAPEPAPAPVVNRSQRRAMSSKRRQLERARIKRDKLVTPKNLELLETVTPRKPRAKPETKTEPLPEPIEDDRPIIAGELVEGDGLGDVLFEQNELDGEFNFRDSILEQLDRYWVYVERMKRHDPDAYDLYSQIGAIMIPYSSMGSNYDRYPKFVKMTPEEVIEFNKHTLLSPWFKEHRPAFGCLAYGTNPLDEEVEDKDRRRQRPKFVYFTKYKEPPPELQPILGGDIYKLTVWWDRQHDKKIKWGIPTQCGIFISRDGNTIQLLRQIETKMIPTRHKKGHRRGRMFNIPQRAWHIPDMYEEWAADRGLTANALMTAIFTDAVKHYERASGSMAQITIQKNDLTAIFGIDPHRTAYFFRDRDIVVNDGVRERIFHSVRSHTRQDGTPVKSHYRGAREFTWAGYKVLITIPGLHHMPISDFNVGATDNYWIEKGEKFFNQKKIGRALRRHIRGESIERAFK